MGPYLDRLFETPFYKQLTSLGPYSTFSASKQPLNNVKTTSGICYEQLTYPYQRCCGRTIHYQNSYDWRRAANGLISGITLLGSTLILNSFSKRNPKPFGINLVKSSLGITGLVLAITGARHMHVANYSMENHKHLMKN